MEKIDIDACFLNELPVQLALEYATFEGRLVERSRNIDSLTLTFLALGQPKPAVAGEISLTIESGPQCFELDRYEILGNTRGILDKTIILYFRAYDPAHYRPRNITTIHGR